MLPPAIFLDFHDTYSFTVEIEPAFKTFHGEDATLSFMLSRGGQVLLESERIVLNSGNILYQVNISDLGAASQSPPGAHLDATRMDVTVEDANLACTEWVNGEQKSRPVHSMLIYSGCAPYQSVSYHRNKTHIEQTCMEISPHLPCFFFEDELALAFTLLDEVTGENSTFDLNYYLQVVAGGRHQQTMTRYTNSEVWAYNPNSTNAVQKIIWGIGKEFAGVTPSFGPDHNFVEWACAVGSPCYGVMPDAKSYAADYYFTFHLTTAGIVPTQSYCVLEVEFDFRLYGIQLELLASVAVTLGSFGAGLVIVLVVLLVQWRVDARRLKEEARVHPEGSGESLKEGGVAEGKEDAAGRESKGGVDSKAESRRVSDAMTGSSDSFKRRSLAKVHPQ
ncbi:hypothetical protein HK101_006189 [Irineochytrium annulatum]|nr:hypothetical protein HK101_006189 [Irineochytrium annulatum]